MAGSRTDWPAPAVSSGPSSAAYSAAGGAWMSRSSRSFRFIGVGEPIEDLRPFDAEEFVEALFAT